MQVWQQDREHGACSRRDYVEHTARSYRVWKARLSGVLRFTKSVYQPVYTGLNNGAAFRQKPALDRLRQIIWHLHHGWQSYRLTMERPEVPRTNNGTEQVIGRFKSRSKQVRGHKTWSGVERAMLLSSGMHSELRSIVILHGRKTPPTTNGTATYSDCPTGGGQAR